MLRSQFLCLQSRYLIPTPEFMASQVRRSIRVIWLSQDDSAKPTPQVAQYDELIARSIRDDLTFVASRRIIFRSGVDALGNPIVVVIAKNYSTAVPLDKLMLYFSLRNKNSDFRQLLAVVDPVSEKKFSVVYVHNDMDQWPGVGWWRNLILLLPARYSSLISVLHIVDTHSTCLDFTSCTPLSGLKLLLLFHWNCRDLM